ncbi:outer membrane protein assembly factor BamB/subtilisin family serine protease/5-hydroxyisourate hydrolase-like protein (transthyretin family) [Evansella vedderi]|uniref:Outer membrane protein assembly factor BamB/subtilisin family serine protease/5-hydroxyisourate hydrolase-like protein (Transthyretin family) n=1 Tax=Evansella vedderi TaxID=38282 RepID=A0ABT9ZWE7_9BACI|nr:glutaminyl-peptide cyclotransferase [Evansella vedderi]MDQ0255290.1 outer membrane protein assembly factor BamB/subtilisin family serine protease/5-hydroxyisourate hydrolase-like protein (transthyretin family) [Evansella vedderi]
MRRTRKHFIRKGFICILIFLLTFSSFFPGMVGAGNNGIIDLQMEDEELEKEREEQFFLEEEQADTSYEDEGDLASILSGLGWEAPDFETNAPSDDSKKKVEEEIYEALKEADMVDVIIRVKDASSSLSREELFQRARGQEKRTERLRFVQEQLQSKAKASQTGIINALEALEKNGQAKQKQAYWIINGVSATVSEGGLKELAEREDIERITLDRVIELPDITVEDSAPRLPEWGLEKIFAPQVWGEYGLKGEGIVVGIMDTGVDGNHEALQHNYRGRDGDHTYSWIDLSGQGYSSPSDGHGHGTHVAGTAVGGGEGEPIGVAPEAEWIAAKIFNDGGGTTTSAIHQAFEWFMAPGGDPEKAPHIVNNSWGNANTYNQEFYEGVQAWVSAGIFPLFAAGNSGPGSQTIGSPASFPDSFAVGATDVNDYIASFSSRGPVFWTNDEGEQVRYLKPEVSAPGHEIYSAWPEALGRGKYHTISGTSMATPHVAGAIALILQANPNLSLNEVGELLESTARVEPHMGSVPNDLYGHGIINVFQAVTEAAFAGELSGKVVNSDGEAISATIQIPSQGIQYNVSEDGEFVLRVREGNHRVTVSAFGYAPVTKNIVVTKGKTTEETFLLHSAPRHSVSGSVINSDGEPVAFAFIRVKDTPLPTVRTNQQGSFQINDLPEGTYTFYVSGEGISGNELEVTVDATKQLSIEVQSQESIANSDWRTANNSLSRNAISANAIDGEKLEEAWVYNNGNKGQILFSTPAAGEGKIVFVTDRGWVTALNSGTGEEVWSIRIGNINRSSATIESGVVYLSGGDDRHIYALDLISGRMLWSVNVGSPAIYESPLYHDGMLYVSSGLTDNAQVTAIEASTGEVKWTHPLGGPSFFGGSIGDGKLFVGTYDNRTFRALDVDNGTKVWEITLKNEGFASRPVYVDGVVYAASTNFSTERGTLHAIDAQSGDGLWQNSSIGDTQAGSPVVYENIVVIGSASQPVIRAFDRETGSEIWENRDVGFTLHNGTVTADGTLYVGNTNGILYGLDILTGEPRHEFTLNNYSTSGVPVTSGKVIVPTRTSIHVYESPGILTGNMTTPTGKPVKGHALVVETGKKVYAEGDGTFQLQHEPGDYTVRIGKYGKKQHQELVTFVSGYEQEGTFVLEEAGEGSLFITVIDERTGDTLENAQMTLTDTPIEGMTNKEGVFLVEDVYEGEYELTVSHTGYVTKTDLINVEVGETSTLTLSLQPIDIAVLNDYQSEMTTILNVNGYTAEERDWDVIDDLDQYEILLLNGAYGSGGWRPDEDTFKNLVNIANDHDVNIIFVDAWGSNYGSIRQLTQFMHDPAFIAHHNGSGQVRLQVDEVHPILEGFEKGDRVTLYMRTGDFAWFNDYSGRHLASIGSTTQGFVGTGVAYKAVSENSAHLLLGSHAAAPWISPLQGWLPVQQGILFNGIDFLLDSHYGQLTGTVQNEAGAPVEASFEILETGVTFQSELNGDDSDFQVYHDEGTYTLEVRASGYDVEKYEVTFTHGSPMNVDVVVSGSAAGTITGVVVNGVTNQQMADVHVTLQNEEGKLADDTVTGSNGRFTFSDLTGEIYTLQFEKEGYIAETREVDLTRQNGELRVEMNPVPSIAVIGDYWSSSANFQAVFAEVGVDVDGLNISQAIDNMERYDVIFVNEVSLAADRNRIGELLEVADQHETSLVFGDSYGISAGVNQLSLQRGDPVSRSTVLDNTSAAGYIVLEEHPIFAGRDAGEFIELLVPSNSRVGYFDGYSGYPLAEITHESRNESHGIGVAFKPRTANSVEILLGGHGFSFNHHKDHYTDEALEMLVQTMVWAANERFNTIEGTITDEDGNSLLADIEVVGEPFSATTDPETGNFSIAIKDGDYEMEIRAYGYDTVTAAVTVDSDAEPIAIPMPVAASVGSISGIIVNEQDGSAINGAHVDVVGVPREGTSEQGRFELARMMPGSYEIVINAEGFVQKVLQVDLGEREEKHLELELKPSPTIGVIVDATSSSAVTLDEYLTERGYIVEHFFYDETEKLANIDLVIANSDFNNNFIPSKEVFQNFLKELDVSRTPVIWTGQHGGRGSIRFLHEYEEDPKIAFGGSGTLMQGKVLASHPLVEGLEVEEQFDLTASSNFHYVFDDYSGETIVDVLNPNNERVGSMVAYKGRTIDSLEILLSNMTFSHSWHPGNEAVFDKQRERIFNNAILWALEVEEALVGELHGTLVNDQDLPVQGEIYVHETGKTLTTNQKGEFYLGLAAGNYELTITAFGHEEKTVSFTMENGVRLDESIVLTSEAAGILGGTAVDTSGGVLSGATVQVVGTPTTVTTDEEGQFRVSLPEGTYDVRVTAPGFAPQVISVEVTAGQETNVTITMSESEAVAVLATSLQGNRIVNLLEADGYEAELYLNSNFLELQESLADYALVIFNDRHFSMNQDLFNAFVERADETETSIIFPSQFGGGTIRDLASFYGDPQSVTQGFVPSAVQVTVNENHPIFRGFSVGDQIEILNNGTSNQQYAYYTGYSGNTIGQLAHADQGILGDGVGYSFRTANSVHVLLGGLAANTYGHPESRWTEDGKQLYLNAVDWAISASLGEITGTVTDTEGEAINGAIVSILDNGMETTTNANGNFRFGIGEGTYTLEVTARGYESQQLEVTVETVGDTVEVVIELASLEGATLSGIITNAAGDKLAGANVILTYVKENRVIEEVVTEEEGSYEFTDLWDGLYELSVKRNGYVDETFEVLIEGEDIVLDVQLHAYELAVIGDINSALTEFLGGFELFAEERDWDVANDLSSYRLIIVNSNKGTEEELEALTKAADDGEVSLVFLGTYGVKEGSIPLYGKTFGYPTLLDHGYNQGSVHVKVSEEHPIFEPFDDEMIRIHSSKSPFAAFENMPGTVLGQISVDESVRGEGISYQFKGKDHVYLFLSSFAVTNMIGPEYGWTSDGKKLFVEALRWAMEAEQVEPTTPVWDDQQLRTSDSPVMVTGTADLQTSVHIYKEQGRQRTLLGTVETEADGMFETSFDLANGNYFLVAEAENFAGVSEASERMQLIVTSENRKPEKKDEEKSDSE